VAERETGEEGAEEGARRVRTLDEAVTAGIVAPRHGVDAGDDGL